MNVILLSSVMGLLVAHLLLVDVSQAKQVSAVLNDDDGRRVATLATTGETSIVLRSLGGFKETTRVDLSGTVESFKKQRTTDGHDPVEYQFMIFEGQQLKNNRTLASYNIKQGSQIDWFEWRGGIRAIQSGGLNLVGDYKMFKLLNLRTNEYYGVACHQFNTVKQVKQYIESAYFYKANCQYMVYHNDFLDDEQPVSKYNIALVGVVGWVYIEDNCSHN